jgi:hypothetical protein
MTPKDMDTGMGTEMTLAGTLKAPHTLEGIVATSSHRWIYPLLIAQAGTFLFFGSLCSAQQVTPSINSNLEQTAGTTSTRRSLTPSSGPTALPDDFTKLRLDVGYQLELERFIAPRRERRNRL